MQKKKVFTVFMLFFGKYAFVGKTTSPRISAVYHRHARGEVYRTREHALSNPTPTLHVLHVAEMYLHECYYWILAYVNVLNRAGYQLLNSPKTLVRANDLRAPAQSIVERIEGEDLDQILDRTKVERPSNADRKPTIIAPAPSKSLVDCKIDIRLTEDEKARFVNTAKKQGMTYRELIFNLLDNFSQNPESASLDTPPWQMKVEKLESKILDLEEKLQSQHVGSIERLSAKNHQLQLIQSGLATYFDLMRPTHNIPLALERNTYKDFPEVHKYRYPNQEGPYIVRPTAIVYGKGKYPPRFILGIGDDNVQYKLRFYPKGNCAGISLLSKNWGKRGAVWLLGARRAPDGAMDLAFAFPLEIKFPYDGPNEYGSQMNRYFADFFHEADNYNK